MRTIFHKLALFNFIGLLLAITLPDMASASCYVPPPGIVGWWKGDGSAVDLVAGNNGTMVNGLYTNGIVGQAFSFDPENFGYGTYTGVQIADQPAYALTNSLTIESWIKPRGPGNYVFFRGDNRPGLDPYGLSMQGNNTLLFQITDVNGNGANVGTTVPYYVWTHVAAILDGTAGLISIYTNGILAAQIATSVRPFGPLVAGDSPGIGIGNLNDGFNNFPFEGEIDEVSLYNRALTSTEVLGIFNASNAGKCTEMVVSPICTPPPDGIVAWWSAQGNAYDNIGTNNGTLVGGSGYGLGEVGSAFQFNNPGDCIRVANSPSLNVGGQGSIEFWLKANPTNALSSYQGLVTSDFFGIEIANGYAVGPLGVSFFVSTDNGDSYPDTATGNGGGAIISAGQWHHVAGTYDGAKLQLYIDGQPWGAPNYHTGNISPMLADSFFSIGSEDGRTVCSDCVSNRYFNGEIDEPTIYNRALSSNEVLSIYLAGGAGKCLPNQQAPVIVVQPTNMNAAVGSLATFNVLVSGSQPLNYQWLVNGASLAGATNASLVLTNITLQQSGNHYSVLISNLVGSVVSSNAMLTVYVPVFPPLITSQSANQVVLLGDTATFYVTATGSPPLSYSWKRNGLLITGATNPIYTISATQLTDSGSKFNCLVTNASGFAVSSNMSLKVIDTISNDLCSGAVPIAGASYTNAQSTSMASSFGDPAPDCIDGFGNGVWYQYTPPLNGMLYVDTFGSDFDTGLAAYTGGCNALTEVACNDDTAGITSQIILPVNAGTTYYLLAGGYDGSAGNLMLHLNFRAPPVFLAQPTNVSVIVSSNASFTAMFTGTQPVSLQWFFNNTALTDGGRISGSTNATLNIAGVITNDGGNYYVVASNVLGVVTSSVAILTPIILPPVFIIAPQNLSVLVNSNATFTATIGGTAPFGFQWSFNGTPLSDDGLHIAGSTTASLMISNLTTADAGNYSLLVGNPSGSTNATASLLVLVPASITSNPIGRSVPPGLPTTFTGAASGIPAPVYQWQFNGANISGAASASYSINNVGNGSLGFYTLVASNSVNTVTSTVAQLTSGPVAAWGRNVSNESLPPPGLSNVVAVSGVFGAGFAVQNSGNVVFWGSGSATNVPASATNVVAISSFASAGSVALRADGTLVGWNGAAIPPTINSNIVSAALGNLFGIGLRAEGTLVGWGALPYSTIPQGLNKITAVACGSVFSIALRNDGTLVVWGDTPRNPALNVPTGLANVKAIAAGYSHCLALQSNGVVVAWGSGSGTNLPAGLTNIIAISANGGINASEQDLSLAIRADNTVIAWGNNPYGETNVPAGLNSLASVAVSAALDHGLALVNDGRPQILQPPIGLTTYVGRTVTLSASAVGAAPLSYQWLLQNQIIPGATNASLVLSNLPAGNSGNFQLLVTNTLGSAISLPVSVNVISSSALTILSQGSPGATNYQGSKISLTSPAVLGNGPLTYQWFFSPTNKNYAAVSGATNDTLVFDPALVVNGGNYYVAISNSITGITNTPALVKVLFAKTWGYLAVDPPFQLSNAVAVAVGNVGPSASGGHYLALRSDGKISPWGTSVFGETNVAPLSNSIVTAVAAGFEDSLALKSDGTIYAWGNNSYAQTNVPANLNGVVAIACGDYHDLALKSDGTFVGWGQNSYLQITNVAATNLVAIAAGGNTSIGLRADGSVTTWGLEGLPQISIPLNLTNIIAVACSGQHFLALRANGTVMSWGNNVYGQTTVPAGLTNVVAISAADNHSVALRNDGTVVTWGSTYPYLLNNATSPPDLANVVAISSGAERDVALFGTRAPVFTVQPWSRGVALPAKGVTNITLTGKVSGVQPVTYQWLLNGTNYPGATNDTLALRYDLPLQGHGQIQPGAYQLLASNSYGVVVSKPAKVTLTIPLGDALDATNLVWTTSGSAQWYGENTITDDGVDAARSGGIGGSQESILQTTLATNAGTVSFWWKVSSEQFFDTLEFRVNGTVQASISGEADWTLASFPVPSGTNILMWRYSKDPTFDSGLDAGFVDEFSFAPAPLILTGPNSVTANLGGNVRLNVVATGTPSLGYQWTQNGNPVGGNSPELVLNNVTPAQDGTYFVTVTNGGGAAVSSPAVVRIIAPQILGSPQLLPDGSLQLTSSDAVGTQLTASDLANFEAQASADLVNWVTLTNALSLTNGTLQLNDASRTNFATRFYRIIQH